MALPPIKPTDEVHNANGVWYVNGKAIPMEEFTNLPAGERSLYAAKLAAAQASELGDVGVDLGAIAEGFLSGPEATALEAQDGGDPSRLSTAVAAAEAANDPAVNVVAHITRTLKAAGVDIDAPGVKTFIESTGARLEANPNDEATLSLLNTMAPVFAERYPSQVATVYSEALELSGFGSDPFPEPEFTDRGAEFARHKGSDVGPGALLDTDLARQQKLERNKQTGWIRFANGVLVNPEYVGSSDPRSGIIYDPNSKAPGSPEWIRSVSEWDEARVQEWRTKLFEYGYLSKEESKVKGVDSVLTTALSVFQAARYMNAGKPIAGDLLGSGASGAAPKVKPIDLRDFQGQIRNDVREQYRRIYGIDPSDGEVATWASYVIRKGMEIQRTSIRKYDTPNTASAATEAGELMIERLENSPEAEFLQESNEENTRLRDTFERMAVVTNSLTS